MHAWSDTITHYCRDLQAAGRSPATIVTRRRWVQLLASAMPGSDPATITQDDVMGWMADNQWMASTRRSVRQSLRSFFGWMHDSGLRSDDPSVGLPRPKVPRWQPRPLPESVYRQVLNETGHGIAHLAVLLAGSAGLRRCEIVAARREDLDESGLWVVGKGGKRRLVPVSAELRREITARPVGWLFPARWGDGHMHIDALGKMARRAMHWQGSLHPLRHRFGTQAYRGTHDLRAVQEVMGHASPATTAIYTAVSDDALRAAVAAAA